MNIRTSIVSLALFAGLASVLAPTPAHACGGTFCDGSVVNPMAVDQTGEDILFIREGDEIEVHVRIEYTGEATAAAKYEDSGAATTLAQSVSPGVRLYQVTKSGLSAEITIKGTKYFKDPKLNK